MDHPPVKPGDLVRVSTGQWERLYKRFDGESLYNDPGDPHQLDPSQVVCVITVVERMAYIYNERIKGWVHHGYLKQV